MFMNVMIFFFILIFTFMGIMMSGFNTMSVWMSMEALTFSTAFFYLNFGKSFKLNQMMIKYLIIQSFSAFCIMIFTMMALSEDITFKMMSKEFDYFIALNFSLISLWLKMGFFPFHSWIMEVLKKSGMEIFFLVNNWNKIIPLFFLMIMGMLVSMGSEFIVTMLIINLIFVMNGIYKQTNFFLILFFSGVMHSMNIFFILLESLKSAFLIYITSYFPLVLFILFEMKKKMSMSSSLDMFSGKNKNFMFLVFTISGFPPSFFFFLKIFFVYSLEFSSSSLLILSYMFFLSSIYMFFLVNIIYKKLFITISIQKVENSFSSLESITSKFIFLMFISSYFLLFL